MWLCRLRHSSGDRHSACQGEVVNVFPKAHSLRSKILFGYMVLVVVIAVVGVWAIYNFAHINGVLNRVTRENYISVLAAENMVGAIERQDSAELLLLLGETRSATEIYQIGENEFRSWLAQEEQNITLPTEGDVVKKITADHDKYDRQFLHLHALALSGRVDEAHQLYLTETEPLFKEIRGQLNDLLQMNHQALMEGNERSRRTAFRATVSTAGVAALAVILAVLLGLGVSRAVVQPTVRLTRAVRRLRTGDLNETVEVASSDEIGELAREFNNLVSRLRVYEETMNDRVAAEQQKALTVITAIDDGVILVDAEQHIVLLNPAAQVILGLDGREAIGQSLSELKGQPQLAGITNDVIRTGKALHNTVMLDVDGENRFFDAEFVPLRLEPPSHWDGAEARVSGTAILLKDVSHFKRLDKMKSDFLSDISHEIRTPLTSISMGIGLLRESKTLSSMDREKELLDTVDGEVARLTSLVGELLELSRLESSRVRLDLQEVPLRELLERSVNSFEPQAEKQQINLRLDMEPGLPNAVVDPNRIQSAIGNLVSNALRYTPSGGDVTVSAKVSDGELRVSVADMGPGIPAESQERVFDRFYQIKGRPGGQAGLGLPICKAIVEAHGGKISVESGPERGSTFSFVIPLARPKDQPAEVSP